MYGIWKNSNWEKICLKQIQIRWTTLNYQWLGTHDSMQAGLPHLSLSEWRGNCSLAHRFGESGTIVSMFEWSKNVSCCLPGPLALYHSAACSEECGLQVRLHLCRYILTVATMQGTDQELQALRILRSKEYLSWDADTDINRFMY